MRGGAKGRRALCRATRLHYVSTPGLPSRNSPGAHIPRAHAHQLVSRSYDRRVCAMSLATQWDGVVSPPRPRWRSGERVERCVHIQHVGLTTASLAHAALVRTLQDAGRPVEVSCGGWCASTTAVRLYALACPRSRPGSAGVADCSCMVLDLGSVPRNSYTNRPQYSCVHTSKIRRNVICRVREWCVT